MTKLQIKARASTSLSAFAALWLAACGAPAGLDAQGSYDDEVSHEDGGVPEEDKASPEKSLQKSTCHNPIVAKPSSVKTRWQGIHQFTRYLKVDKYNVHIVGTASVSDWMMRESCLFNEAIIAAIKYPSQRAKLSGFIAHLTTYKDRPISSSGQRSGGTYLATITCEDMVCGVSRTDPHVPSRAKQYRAWEVPTHEMGHAIEISLGLQSKSDLVYEANRDNYKPSLAREHFAWGTSSWFGSGGTSAGRNSMPQWEYNYLSRFFDAQNQWQPKCTR